MKKIISISAISITFLFFISCSNNNAAVQAKSENAAADKNDSITEKKETALAGSVTDDAAIATIETSDFILKIHKAIPFSLKPKSYEPFKVDPSTKLIALDISVRNKLSTPLNFSRILGMTQIKGKGVKNLVAVWVVAAYEVDYPEANHQKEYDALWSEHFEPNGFHRAILMGLNPKKEENEFTLIVPEKPDFNNPSKKEIKFSL